MVSIEKAHSLHIAYIGGGSRGWAWGFMMDLAIDNQMEGTVRLYDIDKPAAENNAIIGNKTSAHPDAKARWSYEVADTLESALTGADFVVISILPGTPEVMHSDVHAPEAFGVWQSVGDTVGPGGFVRAMRTIPMFKTIGRAIGDYAPEAWVINYTNPMSLCMRTLYEVFPAIRAFGCCHEVFGTQHLLAAMVSELYDIPDVPRQDIKVNVLGINHFTWFDQATYQGEDLFPPYAQFVDAHYDTGYTLKDENWMNSSFACAHRVKFDLFRRYGLIAAAGDRHLAEFVPPWYLKDPETVAKWHFGLTTVDWRLEDLQRRYARSAALVNGSEPISIVPSGEEGHLLIKALLGYDELVSNVNLPNNGRISNLPHNAIVETNALFRKGAIHPVYAGALPDDVLALVSRHVHNQETALHAALCCDYRLALAGFMNDPLMAGVSLEDGDKLLKQMLRASAEYLPVEWTDALK